MKIIDFSILVNLVILRPFSDTCQEWSGNAIKCRWGTFPRTKVQTPPLNLSMNAMITKFCRSVNRLCI